MDNQNNSEPNVPIGMFVNDSSGRSGSNSADTATPGVKTNKAFRSDSRFRFSLADFNSPARFKITGLILGLAIITTLLTGCSGSSLNDQPTTVSNTPFGSTGNPGLTPGSKIPQPHPSGKAQAPTDRELEFQLIIVKAPPPFIPTHA